MKQFEEGFDEGFKDNQDLTSNDFARICYHLGQDWTINHEDTGFLIYKLSNKIKQESLKKEPNTT